VIALEENCDTIKCSTCTDDACKLKCFLCQTGQTFNTSLHCTNCWATLEYEITRFLIIKNGLILDAFEFEANGHVKLNLDLQLKLGFQMLFKNEIEVAHIPIYALTFTIAGIHVDLGLIFALDLNYAVQLSAAGSVDAGVDGNFEFTASARLGEQHSNAPFSFTVTPTWNGHVPKINVNADLFTELGLTPKLELAIGTLFTADIKFNPYVQLYMNFQYPAFPAIATGQWDPQIGTSLFHAGSCIDDHYVQYYLPIGFRSAVCEAVVDLSILDLHVYQHTWSTTLVEPKSISILSGCFGVPHTNEIATRLTFLSSVQYNIDNAVGMNFCEFEIAQDISTLLNVPVWRFNVINAEHELSSMKFTMDILAAYDASTIPSIDVAHMLMKNTAGTYTNVTIIKP
jgi:hypothetical protein